MRNYLDALLDFVWERDYSVGIEKLHFGKVVSIKHGIEI